MRTHAEHEPHSLKMQQNAALSSEGLGELNRLAMLLREWTELRPERRAVVLTAARLLSSAGPALSADRFAGQTDQRKSATALPLRDQGPHPSELT